MRTWFGAHMAGLTKTYQVAANICIFCGGELAERSDVVDRQKKIVSQSLVRDALPLFGAKQ